MEPSASDERVPLRLTSSLPELSTSVTVWSAPASATGARLEVTVTTTVSEPVARSSSVTVRVIVWTPVGSEMFAVGLGPSASVVTPSVHL
ncbi:MAG: hypothetical protein AABZ53_05390 [Planctomycetota bacterium]